MLKNQNKIEQLINANKIILFMKGEKDFPQCGFSMQAVEILKLLDADFATFNILKDEEIRQELKIFSNWPTYPQLYVDGDLIGGIDIMKEMLEEGELEELIFTDA